MPESSASELIDLNSSLDSHAQAGAAALANQTHTGGCAIFTVVHLDRFHLMT